MDSPPCTNTASGHESRPRVRRAPARTSSAAPLSEKSQAHLVLADDLTRAEFFERMGRRLIRGNVGQAKLPFASRRRAQDVSGRPVIESRTSSKPSWSYSSIADWLPSIPSSHTSRAPRSDAASSAATNALLLRPRTAMRWHRPHSPQPSLGATPRNQREGHWTLVDHHLGPLQIDVVEFHVLAGPLTTRATRGQWATDHVAGDHDRIDRVSIDLGQHRPHCRQVSVELDVGAEFGRSTPRERRQFPQPGGKTRRPARTKES